MKPLLLMRAKGVSGPMFAKHYGIPRLSKSAGNFASGDKELRAIRGWTGTENCANFGPERPYAVNFNEPVTFTDHTGVKIVNITTGETVDLSSPTSSPAQQILYDLLWITDPIYGDIVQWQYDGLGNYEDGEGEPMLAHNLNLVNCETLPLAVDSYQIIQTETPNSSRIIRSQVIEIKFNQKVTSLSTIGVTATVHGAQQNVVLSGNNTDTLKYTVQRAIFRHVVTWAYNSALGDIVATKGGEPLGDVSQTTVTNNLPSFTVWDYNAVAPDANTDTTWDSDETRFDEET